MKIGIVTFHRAENFGAALQVFVLQEFLTTEGFDVEIIDYKCKPIEKWYSLVDLSFFLKRKNIFKSFMILTNRFITLKNRKNKKKKFQIFWANYLHINDNSCNKNKISDQYDFYITGSDQIWNPIITDGFDPIFFLQFDVKEGAKKIAYAASSEISSFKYFTLEADKISTYLNSLDAISVREKTLAIELKNYTEKDIYTTLDPTLLLEKSFYEKIIKDPGIRNYIVIYHLYESDTSVAIAKEIAIVKGLHIIEIHAGYMPFKNKKRHIQDADPQDLLGYLYYSDFVVTTSFHGLVLSIIFEKDFYSIDTGHNVRQKDFLHSINLDMRMISNIKSIALDKGIDYSKVNKKLSPMINDSKAFLLNNLK